MSATDKGTPGIIAVCTPGEGGHLYKIGQGGVVAFEEFEVAGQMAYVPWVRAKYEDGSMKEINLAHVEYIDRFPEAF